MYSPLIWQNLFSRQEAIVAAISEKDAHIALLEMAPGPKPVTTRDEVERLNKEKDKLQEQLKELVRSLTLLFINKMQPECSSSWHCHIDELSRFVV